MKTVGIIGGLGPDTTATFYLDIINKVQECNDINRPPILISNVPISYEIERDSILRNIGIEKNIPYLLNESKRLEKADAEFIVMPCNSLHLFINEIRTSVKVPVLSIIEEAVKHVQKKGIQKIGIIATAITVKNKLYENAFNNSNIEGFVPSQEEQLALDAIILNLVLGKNNKKDYDQLVHIIENFKKNNITNILLACTDLQLLNPVCKDVQIYDSMHILAESTVEYMTN